MLRLIGAFVLGGLIGTGVGFAGGIFAYPYIFLTDIVGTDIVDTAVRREVARGEFIHVNPSDPIHYGKGNVAVYDDLVHLQDDFEVGPGPAFHVYLVPRAEVREEADVEDSMYVDLGRLRAFKGSQNYSIPAGVDLADYGSVVIWCERFGVLISPATLKSADG
jgi:Electron transfer DM13